MVAAHFNRHINRQGFRACHLFDKRCIFNGQTIVIWVENINVLLNQNLIGRNGQRLGSFASLNATFSCSMQPLENQRYLRFFKRSTGKCIVKLKAVRGITSAALRKKYIKILLKFLHLEFGSFKLSELVSQVENIPYIRTLLLFWFIFPSVVQSTLIHLFIPAKHCQCINSNENTSIICIYLKQLHTLFKAAYNRIKYHKMQFLKDV